MKNNTENGFKGYLVTKSGYYAPNVCKEPEYQMGRVNYPFEIKINLEENSEIDKGSFLLGRVQVKIILMNKCKSDEHLYLDVDATTASYNSQQWDYNYTKPFDKRGQVYIKFDQNEEWVDAVDTTASIKERYEAHKLEITAKWQYLYDYLKILGCTSQEARKFLGENSFSETESFIAFYKELEKKSLSRRLLEKALGNAYAKAYVEDITGITCQYLDPSMKAIEYYLKNNA